MAMGHALAFSTTWLEHRKDDKPMSAGVVASRERRVRGIA